jgi:3-hydroxyisobutyrate dehydrogenase-like beta-hydroxyacid dehydrogenase
MSRRAQKNVGIIGLGIIGSRVADTLRHRGFHVFVWNRTPRPFPNFVGSPAEIPQLCDFVQIFVSDDDALLEMIQQMKPSLKAHHVIMAHSTVAPRTMRAAAEIVQRRGAQFLDAPFTGSKNAAEKGELVYYVGGDETAYRRARPVLEASSKEIIEIGEIGQATTIKVATNMITAATVQVAAEALALVHSAGVPFEKFAVAMSSNGSNSGTLAMKLPKMIEGDFEPHFSVKHMLKDVEIAMGLARSHGLTLGGTEAARESLLAEMRHERGDADYSSVVHAFFPAGLPGASQPNSEAEEQGTFGGLEDEPAATAAHEEMEATEPERAREERSSAEEEQAQGSLDQSLEGREESVETPKEEGPEEDKNEAEGAVNLEEALQHEEMTEVQGEKRVETAGESEHAAREDEVSAQTNGTADEPTTAVAAERPSPSASAEKENEPRGFFSRIFGKGTDY